MSAHYNDEIFHYEKLYSITTKLKLEIIHVHTEIKGSEYAFTLIIPFLLLSQIKIENASNINVIESTQQDKGKMKLGRINHIYD